MSRNNSRSGSPVSLFPFLAVLVCAMGALIFLLIVTTRRIRVEAIAHAYASQLETKDAGTPSESVVVALPAAEPVDETPTIDHVPILVEFAAEPEPVAEPVPLPITQEPVVQIAEPAVPTGPTAEELEAEWQGIVADLQQKRADLLRRQQAEQSRLGKTRQTVRQVEASLAELTQEVEKADLERERLAEQSETLAQERARVAQEIAELKAKVDVVRRQKASQQSKYAFVPFDGRTGTTRRPIFIECTGTRIRFVPEDVSLTPRELDGFSDDFNPLLAGASALMKYWTEWNDKQSRPDSEPEPYLLLIVRPSGTRSFYVAQALLNRIGKSYGYELVEEDWQMAVPDADPQARAVCQSAIDKVLSERDKVFALLAAHPYDHQRLRLQPNSGGFDFEETDEDPLNSRRGSRRSGSGSHATGPGNGDADSQTAQGANGRGGIGQSGFGQAAGGQSGFGQSGFGQGAGGQSAGEQAKTGRPRATGSSKSNSGEGWKGTNPASLPDPLPNPFADRSTNSRGETQDTASERFADYSQSSNPNSVASITGDPAQREGTTSPVDPSLRPEADSSLSSVERLHGRPGTESEASATPPEVTELPSPQQERSMVRHRRDTSRHGVTRAIPKRWGSRRRAGSIGYERELAIRVTRDQIVVGKGYRIPLGVEMRRAELIDQVISAIDQETRSWGDAPRNFYWVPSLRFAVSPGGNHYYETLHGAFDAAGLRSSVQYLLEASSTAGKSE